MRRLAWSSRRTSHNSRPKNLRRPADGENRNGRFWLRLSKKPRHIGGVKQWNHGGADFDSFLPSAVVKRINLSVLSG